MKSVALRLKGLRQTAQPPLSVRKMAEALGMPLSTYSRYEDPDEFKKGELPLSLAREIARVLADHGVAHDLVMQLAGLGEADAKPPVALTKGEEAWLIIWRAMAQGQRRVFLQLANEVLGWERVKGEPDLTTVLEHAER